MPVTLTARRFATWVSIMLLVSACGKPVGSDCRITGSGFTARDECSTQCLSRWRVNCPDGSNLMPQVCAGQATCSPGSCPEGQACYTFDDPFEKRSYCVPDQVCGPLDPAERRQWEQDAAALAAASRERMAAKRSQQKSVTTEVVRPPDRTD
ncbi:MAG: hypothetical protein ACFHX7_10265 [Pseudomonadota bacterium]